jgi:hypothetical protein
MSGQWVEIGARVNGAIRLGWAVSATEIVVYGTVGGMFVNYPYRLGGGIFGVIGKP